MSIQGEYRYRDNERGDTELLFWKDNIDRNLRWEEETDSWRLGFRHAFSPRSTLIVNFSYNESKSGWFTTFNLDPALIGIPFPPPPFLEDFFDTDIDQDARTLEFQHLFRSQYI